MKKILLTLTVLFLIGSGVARGQAALLVLIFGEKAASENFYFSLKAGVNYSRISGVEEGDNRVGLNFGLINNIKLTDKLYLAPEFVALSPRGIRNVPVITTGNPELDSLLQSPNSTDRRLSYLDIPVLLRWQISKRWSISAGPQLSILTGASDIYRSEPLSGTVLTTELDIKDGISALDLAAVLDLSFMLSEASAGKGMNIFLRYSQGFININRDQMGNRSYNSTFQFGASFPFIETTEGQ